LRCFSSKRKNKWAQWLILDEWWYNTFYHTTTHMTPFKEVYGQNPPSVLSYIPRVSKVQEVEKNITVRKAILRALKDSLVMDRNRKKQQVDQGFFELHFVEEDGYFFDYNIIRKLHSKLNIVRNLRPNFMVLIQCSRVWDWWPII
jgi:hypothetical protein